MTEEIIGDLKEIFLMFDTDVDGVLTAEQVFQAISVLGIRRSGAGYFSLPSPQLIFFRGGNTGTD